jgi:aminoglycoside phosphotransferase (APT) family kinase protein
MAREFRWLSAMHRVFHSRRDPTCCATTSASSDRCFTRWNAGQSGGSRGGATAARRQPTARRAISEAMIDTLAQLHAVDVVAEG